MMVVLVIMMTTTTATTTATTTTTKIMMMMMTLRIIMMTTIITITIIIFFFLLSSSPSSSPPSRSGSRSLSSSFTMMMMIITTITRTILILMMIISLLSSLSPSSSFFFFLLVPQLLLLLPLLLLPKHYYCCNYWGIVGIYYWAWMMNLWKTLWKKAERGRTGKMNHTELFLFKLPSPRWVTGEVSAPRALDTGIASRLLSHASGSALLHLQRWWGWGRVSDWVSDWERERERERERESLLVGCLTSQQHAIECISGTDLLRQFYVLPHWDRCCRSNFLSHPVTVHWHRASQSQRWPYNARRLGG